MMRGTFANIRIRNEIAPGTEGGYKKLYPENKIMPIFDAVVEYKRYRSYSHRWQRIWNRIFKEIGPPKVPNY